MPRSPEIEAWAAGLIARGEAVLHLASGVAGKVVRLYLPGEYKGAAATEALDEYVVELSTGDAFLILSEREPSTGFAVLSPVEVQFLDATAGELSKTIARAVGAALVTRHGTFPITAGSALRLIVVALQGQLRALQQAAEDEG